jgi:hypothetical protein
LQHGEWVLLRGHDQGARLRDLGDVCAPCSQARRSAVGSPPLAARTRSR